MHSSANKMDKLLEDMLGTVIGLDLNQIEGLKLHPGIKGLRGHSFQWWASQLPIKAGGLGLRNQTYLFNVAYCSHWGICPSLGYLAPLSNPEDRWGLLVRSSLRLGTKFTRAWGIVRREATQISESGGAIPGNTKRYHFV